MNKKNMALCAMFAIALLVGITYIGNVETNKSQDSESQDNDMVSISYNSAVCKTITRADGRYEDLGCKHNLFTNMGKNITRDLIGLYAGKAVVNVIGLGNGTAAQVAADNVLATEWANCGLQRAAGTYGTTDGTAGNWTIAKTFTSVCANAGVNATGLYNGTGGNFLFAETTFTSAVLQADDQITVTWYIWVA